MCCLYRSFMITMNFKLPLAEKKRYWRSSQTPYRGQLNTTHIFASNCSAHIQSASSSGVFQPHSFRWLVIITAVITSNPTNFKPQCLKGKCNKQGVSIDGYVRLKWALHKCWRVYRRDSDLLHDCWGYLLYTVFRELVLLPSSGNWCNSWFQTFAMFWMLYAFFWIIPRRLNFLFPRLGPPKCKVGCRVGCIM
jgi:hypothetical protein